MKCSISDGAAPSSQVFSVEKQETVEMGEQVKVVLNLRSAPLNTRAFFAMTNLKPSSTVENPAMNSFSNNRSNNSGWRRHVNTSTDKHCILGIRTVLRLA